MSPAISILSFFLAFLPVPGSSDPNSQQAYVKDLLSQRKEIRKKMERVMGPFPSDDRRVPLEIKTLSEEKLDGYIRRKITFRAEAGDRVPAWLLIPLGGPAGSARPAGPRPAMLCLHQTVAIGKDEPVGLGRQESKKQALHLVKRGYICLAPDYPSFGEYRYDFKSSPFASGSMKAIWNCSRAIDLLESMPEVDRKRIGVIGHSLGGHAGMFAAAFDDRIAVVVTSCGFTGFHHYYGGNLKGWTSDRYMPRIASDFGNDPRKMPFDFEDVLTAIAPTAVLHQLAFEG
ncbi:MAG: alpha/beta fold hydrolase [Gemmataceae bacterium]